MMWGRSGYGTWRREGVHRSGMREVETIKETDKKKTRARKRGWLVWAEWWGIRWAIKSRRWKKKQASLFLICVVRICSQPCAESYPKIGQRRRERRAECVREKRERKEESVWERRESESENKRLSQRRWEVEREGGLYRKERQSVRKRERMRNRMIGGWERETEMAWERMRKIEREEAVVQGQGSGVMSAVPVLMGR